MALRWAIPDIHGCAKTLKALLENHIGPSRYDELYFVGDYIDRGPDSKGVIDYLMHLDYEGYKLFLLKGNHEDYMLKAWEESQVNTKGFLRKKKNKVQKEWMEFGGKQTLASFGVDKIDDVPEKYIQWIKELRLYIELHDYILVHAGLNFNKRDIFEDEKAMLWIREFDVNLDRTGKRHVIHGHVPINYEFITESLSNPKYGFIDLDNGCYMADREGFGNLLAYNMDSREIKVQRNIDY